MDPSLDDRQRHGKKGLLLGKQPMLLHHEPQPFCLLLVHFAQRQTTWAGPHPHVTQRLLDGNGIDAVSYTHLDVYKRQVYTQNLVKGAPILVTQRNIRQGRAQAVICNSGNANTCNEDGVQKANRMCELTAKALKIDTRDVIVASTGVIGQTLPIDPIAEGIPALAASLSKEGGADAAEAILTTDTIRKELAVEFSIGGATCRIGGIAKGSGMIHPNMATMLCFLTTDADIHPELLDKALHEAVGISFNMVSVDGDTSTNDMVSIMASGLAKNPKITDFGEGYQTFLSALKAVSYTHLGRPAGLSPDFVAAHHLLFHHCGRRFLCSKGQQKDRQNRVG